MEFNGSRVPVRELITGQGFVREKICIMLHDE